ncbi:MAG: cellulase family glycosylhydrolase [Bacteroidetes bacterium]|nr:cellulase family glycosylhydrolase [Bacteroidota bacterium]
MGLGGWMLQESYMFKLGNIGQQHHIRQRIVDVVGEEKTKAFYEGWLKNHTTRRDIDSMAAWGFNSIRLPMHYGLYTLPVEAEPVAGQNTWISKGFEMTDSLLAWCRANNMYLILDLHAAPGGQGNDLNISDRDPGKPSLWESAANQQKTIALWRKLAARYAGDPNIGGYDIINEPNWGFEDPADRRGTKEKSNKPLRELMMKITSAIREVDSSHIIIVEGNGFGNNYNGIFPLWDKNMAVSFHKYGNVNTVAAVQGFLNWQSEYNFPLWLGESGENSNTWFTEAIQLVESRQIGWCWWQEKKMGINNPLEIRQTPGYVSLLNYWLKNGPKPTQAEAEAALNQLLEDIKVQNNIYHRDVTDAMFRQVGSVETRPFVAHVIRNGAVVKAVDFDLGRNGYAYHDNDSARYQYQMPQNPGAGNRGWTYRNDGVDIQGSASEYSVFSIEDGEWMQYTVNVAEAGKYVVKFMVSGSGALSFLNRENVVIEAGDGWKEVSVKGVRLEKGTNVLRVRAVKGGWNFKEMKFVKS